MANFLTDSFEGVVGDDIQVYNPNWSRVTGITGATTIGSRLSARGTGAFYRSDVVPPNADYSVSGDIYINSATNGPNLAVLGRVSNTAATYYQANLISGTGIRLARTINGSSTTIETFPYPVVAGNIARVRLLLDGSNVSVYVDDVLAIGPLEDTLITGPGHAGFRIINAGSSQLQLDSISADTLGAAQIAVVGNWIEGSEVQNTVSSVRVSAIANWTEASESQSSAASLRVSLAASWSESSEVQQASIATSVLASASWIESSEQSSIVASIGNSVSMNASWIEGVESQTISGRVDVLSTASWSEASDTNSSQITVGSSLSASANWVEKSEVNTSFASLNVGIAADWFEQGDAFVLRASSGDVEADIDAFLVPSRQTVIFEGSRRVVAFEGGKRVVSFEGSKRLVEFQ